MIYNKEASFPYPILSNHSNYYEDNTFNFFVTGLQEDLKNYTFFIDYEINSPFVKRLIQDQKISMILIIQSEDNKFYRLENNQKELTIPKKNLSLSARTNLQLHLHSKEELTFENCHDLRPFYDQLKDDIFISKNTLIGYSDLETFLGNDKTSLILFENILMKILLFLLKLN